SSQPGHCAWRAGSRASRGPRLRAAAAGRHSPLRLRLVSGDGPSDERGFSVHIIDTTGSQSRICIVGMHAHRGHTGQFRPRRAGNRPLMRPLWAAGGVGRGEAALGGRRARREGAADAGPAAGSKDDGAAKGRSAGRRRKSGGRRVLARLFYWSLVLGLWGVIAGVGALAFVFATLPPIQSLEVPKRPPTVEIVGLDGKALTMRGEMSGTDVPIKELPPYLPKAFVAIEDRRFYSHFGVDPIGLVRAAAANVLRRGVAQGGSTLSQQLAKNLFLTPNRTLWRKMQELVLALWLEHKFSKAQILELYLNRVYFGSGAYGV